MAAPPSALAGSSRPGRCRASGRSMCGTISPTKPMMPVTAVAAPTLSAVPAITASRVRPRSMPRLPAASSPSVRASSARPTVSSSAMPASDERRADPQLRQAAVGQRAHHPEHHLDRGERVLRQIEGERDQRRGDARHGKPGQDQRHRPAVRARQRHHRQHGDGGAREPAERQRQRERLRQAQDGWPAPRPAPRRPTRRPGSARPADCANSPAARPRTARARHPPAHPARRAAGGSR